MSFYKFLGSLVGDGQIKQSTTLAEDEILTTNYAEFGEPNTLDESNEDSEVIPMASLAASEHAKMITASNGEHPNLESSQLEQEWANIVASVDDNEEGMPHELLAWAIKANIDIVDVYEEFLYAKEAKDPKLRQFKRQMKLRKNRKQLLKPLCHSEVVWRTKRGKSYWFYTVKYKTKKGKIKVVSRSKPGYKKDKSGQNKRVPKPRIIIEKGKRLSRCSGNKALPKPSKRPGQPSDRSKMQKDKK